MPVLTPEFLRDPDCMRRVRRFREIMTARGRSDLILPVHFRDLTPAGTDIGLAPCADPETLAYLLTLPWNDFRLASNRDPLAPEARSALAKITNHIEEVLYRKIPPADPGPGRPSVTAVAAWILVMGTLLTTALYVSGSLRNTPSSRTAPIVANPAAPVALPTEVRDCEYCPVMRLIPAGTFVMGTPKNDVRGYSEERPPHTVTIAAAFYLGQTPITVGEYKVFVRENPSHDAGNEWKSPRLGQSDRDPVVNINYYDIQAYAAWLRRLTGKQFTLPSEAQWEYAARGGGRAQGAYYWGDSYKDGDGYIPARGHGGTIAVKSMKQFDFGLYDMLGHVWQWTADAWHPNYSGAPIDGSAWLTGGNRDRCAVRGGSWYSIAEDVRIAVRDDADRRDRLDIVGFRLARPID